MEVKINIESNQIGDTVIDLFKNLTPEKKEDLALQVLKEWLVDPSFLEVRNKETLLIEEYREGKRSFGYGHKKVTPETTDNEIRNDYDFKKELENYKNSKQILIEDLKKEVIDYYKKYIADELKQNETVNKAKEETLQEITKLFPSIISQVLIQVLSDELGLLKNQIQQTYMSNNMNTNMIDILRNKIMQ